MLKSQFIILIFLLSLSNLKATEMSTLSSLTSTWDIRNYPNMHIPIPVKSKDDQLIFVTGNHGYSLDLELDFPDSNSHRSCIISRKLKYNSESRRKATSLGNGKVVFTMLNKEMSRTNPISAALKVQWKLHIIDPVHCDQKELIVATIGENLLDVLPYQGTFDILLRDVKTRKTRVVRYKDSGKIDKSFSAVIPDEHFLKVKMIKEHEPSAGYYYLTPRREEDSSILKKLNTKFEVVGSFEFKHSKYTGYDDNAYSLEHGRFTVCYFDQENRKSLRCLMVDDELKGQPKEVSIFYDHDVYNMMVKNVLQEEVRIFYAKNNKDHSDTVYLQRVTKNGDVEDQVELGIVPRGIHEVYYFEMKNGSHRISISSIDLIMTKSV